LGFDPNQEDGPGFEAMATKSETLAEHLVNQLHTSDFSDHEREIATELIGTLDEWGYLREPVEEVAKSKGFDPIETELVLRMVQEFDPPGVAARDLKECLLLQLRMLKFRFKSHKELLQHLIRHHLVNLEKKNFKVIAKDMGLEMEELGELIELLQELEPRPGRPFAEIENPYITPDIYIVKMNEEYVITMNEDGLPKLRISNLYRSILQQMPEAKKILTTAHQKSKESVEEELAALALKAANDLAASGGGEPAAVAVAEEPKKVAEDPRSYIQNKLRAALWLIRSIHQRQRTIYKVTESIVKNQREFLEHGISGLRPMVLKDIAADIGMHESTISRVTSNKYVHTPQGIFELKFFFSSAIQRTNGDDIAAESVKEKIKTIVKNEDETNPISDQGIVESLRRQGIEIARRTVAKYRELLGILPSSQRKTLVKSKKVR
jgi:RNA polymerase sigma-54 factor